MAENDLKSLEDRISGVKTGITPYRLRIMSHYVNKDFADMIENKKIDHNKVVEAAENMLKEMVGMYLTHVGVDENSKKDILSHSDKVEKIGLFTFGLTANQLAKEIEENIYNEDYLHNLISKVVGEYRNKKVTHELRHFTKTPENKAKMKNYIIKELEHNGIKVTTPKMLDREEELHRTYLEIMQGVHKSDKIGYVQGKEYLELKYEH